MKKDLLGYLAGLCQAASAALLASAIIVPDARIEALFGCYASAMLGMLLIYLTHQGD